MHSKKFLREEKEMKLLGTGELKSRLHFYPAFVEALVRHLQFWLPITRILFLSIENPLLVMFGGKSFPQSQNLQEPDTFVCPPALWGKNPEQNSVTWIFLQRILSLQEVRTRYRDELGIQELLALILVLTMFNVS